jgi:FkbM family methyltransferase
VAARDDYVQGRRFILCDLVHERKLLAHPIVVLDVGARDAFAETPWTALPADMVRLHGFEPDPEECEVLNERAKAAGVNFSFHQVALARRTGPLDFYRYSEQAANSPYPANNRLVSRWCYSRSVPLATQFRLVKKEVIPAISVADWAAAERLSAIDFFKLNVQGAELDVLLGAGPLLDSTLGLIPEQTFNATYVGAPLFGEVYEFIRKAGFSMFSINGMNSVARTHSPIHLTEDRIFAGPRGWPRHQLLEGHFLYLRDPILEANGWSPKSAYSLERCIKLICLAEIFGQVEFAFEMLQWIAGSPQAAEIGSHCREIAIDGARTYREISQLTPVSSAPQSEPSFVAVASIQAELARLFDAVAEHKQIEGALAAQIAERQQLEAALAKQADALESAEKKRLEAALSQRIAERKRLEAKQAAEKKRLEAALAEQTTEYHRLEAALSQQAAARQRVEAALAERTTEKRQLEATQEALLNEIRRLEAKLSAEILERKPVEAISAAQAATSESLKKELAAVYASSSWKITAPVRKMVHSIYQVLGKRQNN